MHRDTKLGLALGMLVIGFAAAFCFPREPATHVVENTVAPNPELAFIPVKAYQEQQTAAAQSAVPSLPASAPNANSASSDQAAVQEVPVPDPQMPADAVPVASLSEAGHDPGQSEVVTRTHQVQVGETLSGIAMKYLGTSQRYFEIYEANRDQLITPDAVKVGMTLRIPDSAAPSFAAGTAASDADPQPTLAFPLQYTIRPGDTLEGISRRYYGEARFVPEIRSANPNLTNPQKLTVGQVLELPVVR